MRSIEELESKNVLGDAFPEGTRTVSLNRTFDGAYPGTRKISVGKYLSCDHLIPKVESSYVFDASILEGIIDFLDDPTGDALYLYGPSGCGKTSAVLQACARLKLPCIQLTLNGRFELNDLIGHPTILKDEVFFVHGPLARAMKYGYVLVLNEVDLADPGELAGLNDVHEGRYLTIVQNDGEIVEPHKNFRFVVTANTRGITGIGPLGNYAGTQVLNSAFLDRFRFISCGYLDELCERAMLVKAVPELNPEFAHRLVLVAQEVRNSCFSIKQTRIHISIPFSTRSLVRWAKLICVYANRIDSAVDTALEHAFAARLSEDESTYVHRLAKDTIGTDIPVFRA